MDKKKPGLLGELSRVANLMARNLEGPINRLADALYGVTIRRSEHVNRGEIVRLEANKIHGRTIVMHPLDAIAAEFPRDYITQSLEVGIYFADRACAELESVNESLSEMADLFADRQAARLNEWMADHGIDHATFAAARYIKAARKYGLEPIGDLKYCADFMRRNPDNARYFEGR